MSFCNVCGFPGNNTCADCKGVVYCSRECQKENWSTHKKLCALAARLSALETAVAAQDARVAAVAAKLKPQPRPRGAVCCGQPRTALTDVHLSCCATVLHGACLARLRDDGLACPVCDDPLPPAPEELFAEAVALETRLKHALGRKKMDSDMSEQLVDAYNMHLEAAKQGHPRAQMRLFEAHSIGVIAERNMQVAVHWLTQAASKHPMCMASANAKVKLGDFHFAAKRFDLAKNVYYAAICFYSALAAPENGPPLKHAGLDATCAKLFNRLGHIMREQGEPTMATTYLRHATVFDKKCAGYHHDLAVQLSAAGDFPAAEDSHRACLALDKTCASALYDLAFLLAKRGQTKKAADFYRSAMKCGHMGAKKQLDKLVQGAV